MENAILQDNINSSNLDNYLIQKKIEIMMDINNKKINSEIKKISDMVYRLNEEIGEIKRRFNGVRSTKEQEPSVVLDNGKEGNQEDLNRVKSREQRPKPRYGDYNPEDVNIDKFFYFGNKK